MQPMQQSLIRTPDGSEIAVYGAGTSGPRVFVVGGIGGRSIAASPMADMLKAAARHGARCTAVDISGTGASKYRGDLSMELWLRDLDHVYSETGGGASLWVGSSIGAWLMLLANRRHPERFAAMCALAPAVDWDSAFLLPGVASGKLEIKGDDIMVGVAPLPRTLVESMARHRILESPLKLAAPLHIIHGDLDREAPVTVAERLCHQVTGAPCTLERLAGDDHGLAKLETKTSRLSFERWLYHALIAAKTRSNWPQKEK